MDISKIQATYGVYGSSKVNGVNGPASVTRTMGTDKVNLTKTAGDFKLALGAAMEAPDVREDLVNNIKTQMDNGTYDYDVDALVDKLLS